MALSRWQPGETVWNQLQQLQGEMNRLFSRWGEDGGRWLGLTAGYPAVNVWEDNDQVYVEAELPGLDLKGLEIYVTGGNQLTLKGERKVSVPEKGVWHRQERNYGSFSRTLTLPYNVDPDRVDARFENGVLLVKLPKHESARPRKISVKGE
jgi:HSP20 family protein